MNRLAWFFSLLLACDQKGSEPTAIDDGELKRELKRGEDGHAAEFLTWASSRLKWQHVEADKDESTLPHGSGERVCLRGHVYDPLQRQPWGYRGQLQTERGPVDIAALGALSKRDISEPTRFCGLVFNPGGLGHRSLVGLFDNDENRAR